MPQAKRNTNEVLDISQAIDILKDFKNELENNRLNPDYNYFNEVANKARLYIKKFSNDSSYQTQLESIESYIAEGYQLSDLYSRTISIIDTLIKDIQLSDKYKLLSPAEYNRFIKYSQESLHTEQKIISLQNKVEDQKVQNIELKDNYTKIESSYKESLAELHNATKELTDERNRRDKLTEDLNTINNEKDSIENALNELLSNAKLEISQLKEEKQKREIAKNSANFLKQAEANQKNAKFWMCAVIAAIIIFVSLLFYGFSSNEELFNVAATILAKATKLDANIVNKLILVEVGKKIATKALIYSMAIYLIGFLVKNYNAQMHNYVVNSHKANALSSTVDLIGTAKQDDGNDKILSQATQAIFTTQRSGYQGVESEPNSPNLITNVLEAVQPKK